MLNIEIFCIFLLFTTKIEEFKKISESPVVSRTRPPSGTAFPHLDPLWRFLQSILRRSLHTTAGPVCQTPARKHNDQNIRRCWERQQGEHYVQTCYHWLLLIYLPTIFSIRPFIYKMSEKTVKRSCSNVLITKVTDFVCLVLSKNTLLH